MENLLSNNSMMTGVLQDSEKMTQAQEILKNPKTMKEIGTVFSNPEIMKKASDVLTGLQQTGTQIGGGKRKCCPCCKKFCRKSCPCSKRRKKTGKCTCKCPPCPTHFRKRRKTKKRRRRKTNKRRRKSRKSRK